MVSNLETIGLGVNDRAGFEKLVTGLAEAAREGLSTPVGDYAVWRSRSGAEVWLHIAPASSDGPDAVREILGITPFFDGSSKVPLNVTERINKDLRRLFLTQAERGYRLGHQDALFRHR